VVTTHGTLKNIKVCGKFTPASAAEFLMPLYGVFNAGEKNPIKTFEGDSILVHRYFVVIFSAKKGAGATVTGTMHLEKGQTVQEIPRK
jgi:hypothetical protein